MPNGDPTQKIGIQGKCGNDIMGHKLHSRTNFAGYDDRRLEPSGQISSSHLHPTKRGPRLMIHTMSNHIDKLFVTFYDV